MISNEERHTTPRQRIALGLVALFMLGATLALYASAVITYGGNDKNSTSSTDSSALTELSEKLEARIKTLSDQYFSEFSSYKAHVKAFNAADVTAVTTTDLKVGSGAMVTDANFTDYCAYYIGWLADETVFDSSFDSFDSPTTLGMPLVGTTSMIQGWMDGIVGMKIGGVREIAIPAELAYGSSEAGSIPANSPLKFVVMLIERDSELASLYLQLYGSE